MAHCARVGAENGPRRGWGSGGVGGAAHPSFYGSNTLMFLSQPQQSKEGSLPSHWGAHCFLHVVKNIIRSWSVLRVTLRVCVCGWRRPAVPLLPSICHALTCPSRRRQPHVAPLTLTCLTPPCLAENILQKAALEFGIIETRHRAVKTSHLPGTVKDAQLPKSDLASGSAEACLIARTRSD